MAFRQKCSADRADGLSAGRSGIAVSAIDVNRDSRSHHGAGYPARFARRRAPRCPAAFCNLSRLAAKKRPNERPFLSFSIRSGQFSPRLPSRSKIPATSAEILAFPCERAARCNRRKGQTIRQERIAGFSLDTPDSLNSLPRRRAGQSLRVLCSENRPLTPGQGRSPGPCPRTGSDGQTVRPRIGRLRVECRCPTTSSRS